MSLKEQLAEYRADWYKRVPPQHQAIMQRHIDELRNGAIARRHTESRRPRAHHRA
jgi:hypothetical protein